MNNPEHCRNITKLFLLLSLSALHEHQLYRAFRSELNYREHPYEFPDDVLSQLLDTIKEHHPDISHLICSDVGSRLMNIYSCVCDYVIADFVETDTPILTVHDSFIVPTGHEERLDRLIKEAFRQFATKGCITVKLDQNPTKTRLYAHSLKNRDWFLDMFQSFFKSKQTNGYQRRLERHIEHFGR